jgi:6-phosphofructokinase
MLACLVDKRLNELKKQGLHKSIYLIKLVSFAPVCHFFGYQGRCAIPNRIDQNISYTYGRIAKNLI